MKIQRSLRHRRLRRGLTPRIVLIRALNLPMRLMALESGATEGITTDRKAVAVYTRDGSWRQLVGRGTTIRRTSVLEPEEMFAPLNFVGGREEGVRRRNVLSITNHLLGVVIDFRLDDGQEGYLVVPRRIMRSHELWTLDPSTSPQSSAS